MKQIRNNVFETNSSSTHSFCICTEEQFEDWKRGNCVYDYWNEKMVSTHVPDECDYEAAKAEYEANKSAYHKDWEDLPQNTKDEYVRSSNAYKKRCGANSYDFSTFTDWWDGELHHYEEHFVTPSGDKMVAFGQYGYDG